MIPNWEHILQDYRSKGFFVFTREQLFEISQKAALKSIPASIGTSSFLHHLSDPTLSPWDALFLSVKSVHQEIGEEDALPLFRQTLLQTTRVAAVYGEHFSWKSPDKWRYIFEVINPLEPHQVLYVTVYAPATCELIQQAEAILGLSLPPTYTRLLKFTNGLGFSFDEVWYVLGVGEARAKWENVLHFQELGPKHDSYHEITYRWVEWQNVLAYERERDRETGINTFVSDERNYVPFASTFDLWCFDRSQTDERGEYPVVFWDHETCEASENFKDFETWLGDNLLYSEY